MAIPTHPVGFHHKGPLKLGAGAVRLSGDPGGISAAVTLTADESNGQHYILDGGTGVVVTLPAPTKGWSCKFTVGALFSTNYVITAATAGQFQGNLMEVSTVEAVSAADTITINAAADAIGDYLELSSDGTSIFAKGAFLTIGAVTVA